MELAGHANRIQRKISYRTELISSIASYKRAVSQLSGHQDLHPKTFLDHLSQHVNSLYLSEKKLIVKSTVVINQRLVLYIY